MHVIKRLFCFAAFLPVPLVGLQAAQPTSAEHAAAARVEIQRLQPVQPISRAKRPAPVTATVINLGERDVAVKAELWLPKGVRVLCTNADKPLRLASDDGVETLTWELEAESPLAAEVQLELTVDGQSIARQSLSMNFLPAVEMRKLPYIPEPKPVPTDRLIGAHHCPLWESDKPNMWLNVLKHPERTPALGFYSQENPEVADWETKWAVAHFTGLLDDVRLYRYALTPEEIRRNAAGRSEEK